MLTCRVTMAWTGLFAMFFCASGCVQFRHTERPSMRPGIQPAIQQASAIDQDHEGVIRAVPDPGLEVLPESIPAPTLLHDLHDPVGPPIFPTEANKIVDATYIVEPPDILLIELVNPVPKPPYRLQPTDALRILAVGVPEFAPLNGDYVVQPQGTIDLGEYGAPRVAGRTLEEIQEIVSKLVSQRFAELAFRIDVGLSQAAIPQTLSGPHLVRPDGTVGLGVYGSVFVSQMPLEEVRYIVTSYLSQFFLDPQVAVDVISYNSKVYYVITDNGGAGQTVVRLPHTGNETVLDAISLIGGLGVVSSQKRIWVSRPAYSIGNPTHKPAVLPVDWKGIVRSGYSETNYQLMPGDRIHIDSELLIRVDSRLAKFISPIERILGVTLLASTTVNSIQSIGRRTTSITSN